MNRALSRAAAFAACYVAVACNEKTSSPKSGGQPSPNASILPAPLASVGELGPSTPAGSAPREGIPADSAGRLIVREPEPPPPEAIPVARALSVDTVTAKDGVGYTIEGAFHWADIPTPASGPEVSAAAIKEAQQKTDFDVTVDLGNVGRMRFGFVGASFPLPAHTELRARTSYYGHVLVWPNGNAYRTLSPGSLRAMLAERRADVAPLMRAKLTSSGVGNLLGHKTIRTEIETSVGTLTLEQASVPGSGTGGELFCRLLVEVVGAEPTTEACRAERIPLSAQYRWAGNGKISFAAKSLTERKDIAYGYLNVPPSGAAFTPGELPPSASGVFLTREDLAKFRTRAVRAATLAPRAPGEGILAENLTSALAYLLVDGVPVAWVRPREQQYVIGPPAGRYTIAFRDFFGTETPPAVPTDVPAFVRFGSDGDAATKP
jgi:hypothetical protein